MLFSGSALRRKLRWGNREKILYFEEVAARFVHAGLFFTEIGEEPFDSSFFVSL